MRKSLSLAFLPLLALTGCSNAAKEQAPPARATIAVEQVAVQVPTIRQSEFLTEVKKLLSAENDMNDIQMLAAGYEACLLVSISNKDAYREKVLSAAESLEAGLDTLVIAAGAKGLLCP